MSAPNAWLAVSAATDPTNAAISNPFRIVLDVSVAMIPSSLKRDGKNLCV
jgi:hypothetical protein